jgi:hypothetical protein
MSYEMRRFNEPHEVFTGLALGLALAAMAAFWWIWATLHGRRARAGRAKRGESGGGPECIGAGLRRATHRDGVASTRG